jgi:predicted Zn finger-like uncharacterized protein
MPISVTCPECQATYRVADEAAGKAIKCKKCGARVPVPAEGDAAEEPVRAGNSGDDGGADTGGDSKTKKKGGSSKVVYIIVGVLLGACCLCTGIGGAVGYWLYSTGKGAIDELKKKEILVKGDKDFIFKDFGKDFGKDLGKDMPNKGVTATGATVFDKSETLTTKDPAVANGKPAKVYKVKLEAGKEYVIDMKASGKGFGHDPYLILLDPQNKEAAKDDDSGGGLDAQIVYRPAAAGEYTIQATVLGGVPAEGLPFRVTVKLK